MPAIPYYLTVGNPLDSPVVLDDNFPTFLPKALSPGGWTVSYASTRRPTDIQSLNSIHTALRVRTWLRIVPII